MNYFFYVFLEGNGNPGKQVRYVKRELGELAGTTARQGFLDISKAVSLYIARLPKPDESKRKMGREELVVIRDLEARTQFVESIR